jgi:hypothetical protein
MEECSHGKMIAIKLFIAGLILILARLYTVWDMWIVVGALLIIGGLAMFIIPMCHPQKKRR